MLRPARVPFEVWANAPWPDDEWRIKENGSPVDLTGKTLTMQVRQYERAAGDPLIDLTSADGSGDRIEVTAATDGRFRPVVGAVTMEGLPYAILGRPDGKNRFEFSYDIQLSGRTVIHGPLYVNSGVTR